MASTPQPRSGILIAAASLLLAGAALIAFALPAGGRAESAATPALSLAPAAPAAGGAFSGDVPRDGGTALLATSEDSDPPALATRLSAAGCNTTTIELLISGASSIYVVGAPPTVNAAFPATIAAQTPFFVRCAPGGLAAFRYSIAIESIGTLGTMVIDQTGDVVLPDREFYRIQMDLGARSSTRT